MLLFMKGSVLFPQCGFSSRAVAILDHLGVPFETVDVLQDQEIRAGIKEYSDWPTVPQLYVKGEFVGGSDIMMEMFESGELQQLIGEAGDPIAPLSCRGPRKEPPPSCIAQPKTKRGRRTRTRIPLLPSPLCWRGTKWT